MNDLNKLLNEPESPQLTETKIPKKIEKPSAATNKANALIAQEKTMAAASIGSPIYKSAKDFLADNPEVRGHRK